MTNGIPDPGRASKAVAIAATATPFDLIRHERPDGSEYWLARELHPIVGYERWERFVMAIERAQAAADNSGMPAQDHFRPSSKKVDLGSGAERWVADFELTRYGAYLSVMNGDPRKPQIAAAQSYFAIRTHQAEQIEQRLSVEDRAIKRLAVLQAAKGLIDDRHLEAKARCQLAIGLGEAPELEPSKRPLYAQSYLEERGLSRKQIKAIGGMFGKRLKAAFIDQHGTPPKQYPLETGSGQIRNVNAYTEQDRALMDAVWDRYYAAVVS